MPPDITSTSTIHDTTTTNPSRIATGMPNSQFGSDG